MADSRNKLELEILDYPDEEWMNAPLRKPTKPSPATLGFNSHVIKPELRVNKAEDAMNSAQKGIIEKYGPIARKRIRPGEIVPEPPNQNILIIEQAEGVTKVILELLGAIESYNTMQRGDVQGCIWTLEGWLNHNLKNLRKVFE